MVSKKPERSVNVENRSNQPVSIEFYTEHPPTRAPVSNWTVGAYVALTLGGIFFSPRYNETRDTARLPTEPVYETPYKVGCCAGQNRSFKVKKNTTYLLKVFSEDGRLLLQRPFHPTREDARDIPVRITNDDVLSHPQTPQPAAGNNHTAVASAIHQPLYWVLLVLCLLVGVVFAVKSSAAVDQMSRVAEPNKALPYFFGRANKRTRT